MNTFLHKENFITIWEVIRDEEIFKFQSKEIQEHIFQMFTNNIKPFYEVEKVKINKLIDLNKKFILLIINYIKKSYPCNIPNKIKIFNDEPENKLITYEEIQMDRKTQFEKDLLKKQEDFESIVNVKVPPIPKFLDNYQDEPISEMNILMNEITNKRNYDIEELNKKYQVNENQVNNWLKPLDTSIKSEKFNSNSSNNSIENTINPTKINNNNILQKNVTWGENKEILFNNNNNEIMNIDENEMKSNIYYKLKKIENKNNIHISLEENKKEERLIIIENEIKQINITLNKIIDLISINKI